MKNPPNALKLLIGLIGDIATQFPQNAGVKLKSTMPYIAEAIMYLQGQQAAEFKEQATYTLKAINSMNVPA